MEQHEAHDYKITFWWSEDERTIQNVECSKWYKRNKQKQAHCKVQTVGPVERVCAVAFDIVIVINKERRDNNQQ